MKTDQTLALLTRENPVHENDLPGAESIAGEALKAHILLDDATLPARQRHLRVSRSAVRLAVAGIAAAAVAFGVLSLLPGTSPSAVARAASALDTASGTILHTVVVTKTTGPDGSSSNGKTESWRQQSPPYDERSVDGDGRSVGRETATVDGRPEVYLPGDNTLHVVVPGTKLPPPGGSPGTGDRLIDDIRDYLASGQARADDTVSVDGREALRITFAGSQSVYLADAHTYEPIELHVVADDGTVVTSRFAVYEFLPATPANLALLNLRKQHPDATVVRDGTVEGFGPDSAKEK